MHRTKVFWQHPTVFIIFIIQHIIIGGGNKILLLEPTVNNWLREKCMRRHIPISAHTTSSLYISYHWACSRMITNNAYRPSYVSYVLNPMAYFLMGQCTHNHKLWGDMTRPMALKLMLSSSASLCMQYHCSVH